MNENSIEVAVNGEQMGKVRGRKITNTPTKLAMTIGEEFGDKQFHGYVSNIQVMTDGNLTNLSAFPCKGSPNAALPWDPQNWEIIGQEWSLTEEFEHLFCNITDNYNLAISSWITFQESMDICKYKLNYSLVSFEEDRDLFNNYVSWHNVTSGGDCYYVWTPFSDEHTEDVFLNMNTNTEAQLASFWEKDEPNGGRDENFVQIVVQKNALNDANVNSLSCSSCLISSSLLLQLDGRCEESLIGNFKIKRI